MIRGFAGNELNDEANISGELPEFQLWPELSGFLF